MRVLSIEVAVGSQFVAEHIADARCRSTRATILVKYGWEVSVQSVVHMVGAATGSTATSFGTRFTIRSHK